MTLKDVKVGDEVLIPVTIKSIGRGYALVETDGCDDVGLSEDRTCYPLPVEPAFKFGDEVEGSNNLVHWAQGIFIAEAGNKYCIKLRGEGILSFQHIRPIPAKPTLEKVIEAALWDYEAGVSRNLDNKELRKNFVSCIKAALEAGKHE